MNEDLREEPNSLTAPPLWALPKQRLDPPPCTQPGTLGHFFGPFFTILQGCLLPKTVSAPNHLGKRLDPPKNKDMPI